MTNRFMISVAAAALLAGTGFASAQGPGRDAPAAGSAVQQSAPSSERGSPSAAPMNRDSGGMSKDGMSKDGMKDAQSKDGMSKDGMKGAQSKDSMSKDGVKDAQSKDSMSKDGVKDAQSKDGMSKDGVKADTKGTADSKSGATSTTTGNAATSATAAPPPEKQTQIVTAIRSENIPEATNVNVNISIGVALPSTVRFYPLPPRIVEIYPEWRGYEVVRIHGRWVIVRPQTRTIVYIIEG